MKRPQSPQDGVRRYVSYLRVSTDKQGIRGLGIEAQRNEVASFVRNAGPSAKLLGEYLEVESGRKADRPQLLKAMDHARNAGATLLIAKLDRLSRDVHFLTGLERSGIEFIACDLPNANRLTITILAAVAEHERELISQRTKAALAVARDKVRHNGQRKHPSIKRLGNPQGASLLKHHGNARAIAAVQASAHITRQRLSPILNELSQQGITSTRGIANALNERGVLTPRGGHWHHTSVHRLIQNLGL